MTAISVIGSAFSIALALPILTAHAQSDLLGAAR